MPSPYFNYFNRLFGKRTATPAPPPAPIPFPGGTKMAPGAEKKYVQELDKVLHDSQMKLSSYINSLDYSLRSIKNNMSMINFTKPPGNSPIESELPSIPSRAVKTKIIKNKPISGFDFKTDSPTVKTSKRKANLPINTIFENSSVNWKKKSEDLIEIMNSSYQGVANVLLTIAKDSGYTPKGTNIKSLISDLENFRVLDNESALEIKKKLIRFAGSYKQLESWLALFRRMESKETTIKKTP
jgi:hypothetical protein